MTFSIRTKMTVLCCLFLLVFIPSTIFLLRNLEGVVEDFKSVVHDTGELIAQSHLLSKLVIDMETGQRGFIITGKEEFLEPYNIANAKFDKVLAELRDDVSDRPKYLNTLEKIEHLRYKWIGVAGQPEIEARKLIEKSRFDFKTINQMIIAQKGKHILDKIRATINAMSDDFRKAGKKDELILILQIIKDVVDSETGERGFLLAGKDWFLEPYYMGQLNFSKHVEQLEKMLAADKKSMEKLSDVRELYGEWLVEAARPEIDVRVKYEKDQRDMDYVVKLLSVGTGKKIIDELREIMGGFSGDLTKEMKRKLSHSEQSVALSNIFSLIIGGTGILLSISLAFFIGRSITKPITVLRKGTEIIGNGDLSHRIGLKGRDELGLLSDSFNKMTEDLKNTMDNLNREIADRRQTQKALQESEERLKTLIENAPDGIYVIDPMTGGFIDGNRKTEELVGYPREELIDKNFVEAGIFPEEYIPKAVAELEKNRQGQLTGPDEYELLRKDRSRVFVEIMSFPVARKGKVEIIGIARDISERKLADEEKTELQAQLQQAQKMESIGTLAGGIAHNFNNLLMGIQGNASIVLLDIDSSNPRHKNLKNIEKLVENGAKLTAQLIGYAREGKYVVKPISLNQLVKETSDTFGMTKKEIWVHQELSQKLYGIEADQGQIEQLLLNLYVNAVDAMSGGGELFLRTINVTDKDITDKPYETKPGNYVLLTVKDTGVGMDKGTKERIFEPFFTTKGLASGTGLGMASAYGIIKGHGGYIDVDSEKGKGTTFSIYLPAIEKVIEEKKVLSDELVKGKGTVLLVDDEEMVLEVGEELLTHLGYEVLLAENGQEALELYKKNQNEIDLVLLDMVMPVMGGGETFDRMKEIDTNVKVLLSSGYSLEGGALPDSYELSITN